MRSGRIESLTHGVTDISRWRVGDEVHLPDGTARIGQPFLPESRPLDTILRPETLEDRLTSSVVPIDVSSDLLQPVTLRTTRQSLEKRLVSSLGQTGPASHAQIEAAISILRTEEELDEAIRTALAALLRG